MLTSTQKRSQIPNNFEKGIVPVLAVGAAFTIDQLFGAHGNATRRTNPEFHTARLNQGARHTLGVLPGCQTNGRMFFDSLVPLTPNTKLIATDYPEHTFNVEAVCAGLANQLIKNRAERPALLCESMGGIVMRHFLHYAQQTGVAEKVGGFGPIVLDASPFDLEDVSEHHKRLLNMASSAGVRSSMTLDFLKRQIYSHVKGPMSAGAHLDTISAEGQFMGQTHPDGPLPDIMEAIHYVHGPSDHVVDTNRALARYQAIAPAGKFFAVQDTLRAPGEHTALYEHQPLLLQLAGVEPPIMSHAA